MFGWFKKDKKGCQLQHYKMAGYSLPANMKLVLRFDRHPDKWGGLGYSIYECEGCGLRAFACSAYLIEPTDFTNAVDDFIGRKIGIDDLLAVFAKYNTSYEIKTAAGRLKGV